MTLGIQFSSAVLLLLACSLGLTAALVIRRQNQALNAQVLERSRTILSLGEASRDYARQTLAPAVRKDDCATPIPVQGAGGHVAKPIQPHQLSQAIADVFAPYPVSSHLGSVVRVSAWDFVASKQTRPARWPWESSSHRPGKPL